MKTFFIEVERVVSQIIVAEVSATNENKALEQVLSNVENKEDWINKEISYTKMSVLNKEPDRIDIGAAFY